MDDFQAYPDARGSWLEYLQEAFPEIRVTGKVVDDVSFIRLGRLGGPEYDRFSDFPMVSVDVYAADEHAAAALAGKVRGAILGRRGKRLTDTVACKRISETAGPYDNPDGDRARMSWSFQSRLRAVTTTQGESA